MLKFQVEISSCSLRNFLTLCKSIKPIAEPFFFPIGDLCLFCRSQGNGNHTKKLDINIFWHVGLYCFPPHNSLLYPPWIFPTVSKSIWFFFIIILSIYLSQRKVGSGGKILPQPSHTNCNKFYIFHVFLWWELAGKLNDPGKKNGNSPGIS